MSTANLVVLRGRVSSPPRAVDLPSGTSLCQLEVTTRVGAQSLSVPVAWPDPTATIAAGDEIVVVGHVRRRWFRAGGATVSRTEVVATDVVPATRRRAIARALDRAAASIVEPNEDGVSRRAVARRARSGASA
jgi:single-strand DNA-binding protein